MTDDQDVGTLTKPHFLPRINKYLIDEGVVYDNFFTPVSICCPSRASLFRTQLGHNHNISFVSAPWGGWELFNKYGYVHHTLPDFLQQAGYDTYYTGKLMNEHSVDNCERLPVSGFNSSDFLVDPYTYDYWHPAFSRDSELERVGSRRCMQERVLGLTVNRWTRHPAPGRVQYRPRQRQGSGLP